MNRQVLPAIGAGEQKREKPHHPPPFRASRHVQPGPGWLRQTLRERRWEVYYDGDCGFCRRWAMRAKRWCNPLIQWRNFRVEGEAVAHLHPRFEQAAYLIIDCQLALPGFFAFRKLVLASPRLWPLLALVYFPGSGRLGPVVYKWIGSRYGPISKRLRTD